MMFFNAEIQKVERISFCNINKRLSSFLPYNPRRYFSDKPIKLIYTGFILPTRARRKGILNANKFMLEAYNGYKAKRQPITIYASGLARWKFICLDGNSTLINAKLSNWEFIAVKVVGYPRQQ